MMMFIMDNTEIGWHEIGHATAIHEGSRKIFLFPMIVFAANLRLNK